MNVSTIISIYQTKKSIRVRMDKSKMQRAKRMIIATWLNNIEKAINVFESATNMYENMSPGGTDNSEDLSSTEHTISHLTPNIQKNKRARTSYRAVVSDLVAELKTTISNETDRVMENLERLQKEDQNWQQEMQEKDQIFLQSLITNCMNQAPAPAPYYVVHQQ